LSMRDNGLIPASLMPDLGAHPHIYHLVPDGVSKGEAVAWDLARRGIARHEAIAIGDSSSDLAMAPHVGRMHMVANGVRHLEVTGILGAYDNVVLEPGALGAGWTGAVRSAIGTSDNGVSADVVAEAGRTTVR
nr:HAD hydrolase family protein [Micromonospora sp. DSM 115978]